MQNHNLLLQQKAKEDVLTCEADGEWGGLWPWHEMDLRGESVVPQQLWQQVQRSMRGFDTSATHGHLEKLPRGAEWHKHHLQ